MSTEKDFNNYVESMVNNNNYHLIVEAAELYDKKNAENLEREIAIAREQAADEAERKLREKFHQSYGNPEWNESKEHEALKKFASNLFME